MGWWNKFLRCSLLGGVLGIGLVHPLSSGAGEIVIDQQFDVAADFAAWRGPVSTNHLWSWTQGVRQNMTNYLSMADNDTTDWPYAEMSFGRRISRGQVEVHWVGSRFGGTGTLRLTDRGIPLAEVELTAGTTGLEVTLHHNPAAKELELWTAGEDRSKPKARKFTIAWDGNSVDYFWEEIGGAVHSLTNQPMLNAGVPEGLHLEVGYVSVGGNAKIVWLDRVRVSADETLPASGHPLLAVTTNGYHALQLQARASPWKEMAKDARSDAASLSYSSSISGYNYRCYRLLDLASANTLAYLLDSRERLSARNRTVTGMTEGLQDLRDSYSGNIEWLEHVPRASALVHCILALDVMYDHLTVSQRQSLELLIQQNIDQLTLNSWRPAGYTVRMLWERYLGNFSSYDSFRMLHDTALLDLLSSDGVFRAGSGYGINRLGEVPSMAKNVGMDILELQGMHHYYSDPVLQAGHEFVFGYAVTPFGGLMPFGDTMATDLVSSSPQVFRAHRFSERAGRYAAWHLRNTLGTIIPSGHLVSYLTMTEPVSELPELAPSRLFGSYAGFISEADSAEALFAGLLSAEFEEGHAHKEVNAIALGGYGEFLLRNAGYNGWGNPAGNSTWAYINQTAESGNTVLIDGVDHQAKIGAGIVEGFTGLGVEYAQAESGNALPNGSHRRSLIFIQASPFSRGYWVVADDVQAVNPSASVNLIWHPNATTILAEEPEGSYRWTVDANVPARNTTNDVSMTAMFSTPAQSVQIKSGVLASGPDNSFDAPYLYTTFPTDSQGEARVFTLLFPDDHQQAAPSVERIVPPPGQDYHGLRLTQGGYVDTLIESDGAAIYSNQNLSYCGRTVISRDDDGESLFAFVREGTWFADTSYSHIGFSSVAPISVLMAGREGQIVSPGTEVTFYYPSLAAVVHDDQVLPELAGGNGFQRVDVPEGTAGLRFLRAGDDFDADLLPDLWEWTHFNATNKTAGTPTEDYDHDGSSDSEEYTAGTSPVDALDLLVAQSAVGGPGTELRWIGRMGRRYRVEVCTNLATGIWIDLGFEWLGTGVELSANPYITPSVNPARPVYGRVLVEMR